jgi:large subunit ribosomal protein L21
MYAVIKTGGKHYKVAEGDVLRVEKLDVEAGKEYTFESVSMVENSGAVKIGQPFVSGAKVVADVVDQIKGPKLTVFFYRHKTNHKKMNGHRQPYSEIKIKQIIGG